MDSALAAALLPLAPSPRLLGLGAKLPTAGVVPRIDAALPTVTHCLAKGCNSVVLCSHLGRPDASRMEKFSLAPVTKCLEGSWAKA